MMRKELLAKPTQLYRHFGAEDELLYVGISLRSMKRLVEHRQNSDWFDEILRVEIEHFPDRESAMDAERKAVQEENPKYNKRLKKPKKLKNLLYEPTNDKLEAAKDDIVYRLVTLSPLNTLDQAGNILGIRVGLVRELIESNKLSIVELPPHREGCKPRQLVTGWSILTCIEMLEQDQKEKRYAVQKPER